MTNPDRDPREIENEGVVVPFPGANQPEPEVIEAEIVEDEPGAVVPVNPPTEKQPMPWHRDKPLIRPVIPKWLSDPLTRKEAGRWVVRYSVHRVLYHGVRTPVYAVLTTVYAPRGGLRIVTRVWHYMTDSEIKPLAASAVLRDSLEDYLHVTKVRSGHVHFRRIGVTAALVGILAGALFILAAPVAVQLVFGAVVLAGLAKVGQPMDRPILGKAVVVPKAPRLTDAIVTAALESIGIKEVTFSAPIQRDGPGWRACVELPLGTTVTDVVEKREPFASGLRRPLGCVWPELETDGHPGQLVLWVGDRDLSKLGKVKWSLLNKGQADYFEPMPFGVDQRGRPILLPLYQHNVLIGSLPGQGKTGAVRVLTCGAALDPTAELWLHELKGSGDLDPLENVSHRFVSGIDDESIEYARDSLRLLREEVVRRTKALKDLPRDLCPDKRVTREIADKRSLRLHPLVCVIDECQNLFAHPDYGAQAGEDATFIIKIGRAFGVTLILATQRPDSKSLPTGVSGNVSIRFCLKVAGQTENDMVLGTSAYKNGLRATMFRAGVDAGIGYLVGAAADPIVCRTAYLDQLATEQVAVRARALREAAGTLSGHALGEAPDRAPTFDLLDDLQTVYATAVRTDQPGVWSQVLCDRLAELRPEVYGGWKADQLGTVLAALDPPIETVQLNQVGPDGQRHNWRGVRGDALTAALTARADRKGITP